MKIRAENFAVSVVIPTYNREATLCRAIESVLRQTFPPAEILVIDDGSVDKTAEMIRQKFPAVRYVFQQHAGVSVARNRGILQSRSPFVAFLDSDDEWLPEKLSRQREAILRSNGARICHSDEIWIRSGKRVNPKIRHQKFGGNIYLKCLPLCCISPSAVIIHKTVFETAGYFDPELPVCEDYDLWLRVCSRYPVLYIEDPLIKKYGGHKDQLSRAFWGMDRFRILALEKSLKQNRLTLPQKKQTVKAIITKIKVYLRGAEKRGKLSEVEKYQAKLQFYTNMLNSTSYSEPKTSLNFKKSRFSSQNPIK